jgi:phospholipase D1/2
MEANSGVKFLQAQVALSRQWIGSSAVLDTPTEVAIKLPEPTPEGIVLSEKSEVKTEKYQMPLQYSDAVAVIERFQSGANALVGRRHDAVADTVGQHALQDVTQLADEQWLGSEEEELNSYVISDPMMTCAYMSYALDRYVSELSYIHTKLMIVDDRRVIVRNPPFHSTQYYGNPFLHQMGSANFNDRSQRVRTAGICK